MAASPDVTVREHWSQGARRLGIASSLAILSIGVLYMAVIISWLIVEATPGEPIGDPYLAAMEVLTIGSALALPGLLIAIWCFADAPRRLQAIAALIAGSLAAGLTMAVHFVQLTAVRQLWRTGQLLDYRLVWPSPLFAVEYFAWDILVGLTMVLAGFALTGGTPAAHARRALLTGGSLCLAGMTGPLSGWMLLQNVALLGYGVILPIAGALTGRMFWSTAPSTGSAA